MNYRFSKTIWIAIIYIFAVSSICAQKTDSLVGGSRGGPGRPVPPSSREDPGAGSRPGSPARAGTRTGSAALAGPLTPTERTGPDRPHADQGATRPELEARRATLDRPGREPPFVGEVILGDAF